MSKHTQYKILLNGIEINPPLNWDGTKLFATFENDTNDSEIESEPFLFVGEAYNILSGIVDRGTFGGAGIFASIPFQIKIYNDDNDLVAFNGYVDLTDNTTVWNDNEATVSAKIVRESNSKRLDLIAATITVQQLYSEGLLPPEQWAGVRYTIAKQNNPLKDSILTLSTFIILKTIKDGIKEQLKAPKDAIPVTNPLTSAWDIMKFAFQILIDAAYYTSLAVSLSNLIFQIFDLLTYKNGVHYTLPISNIIRAFAKKLDIGISSEVRIPATLCYLPSKPNFSNSPLIGTAAGRKENLNNTDPIPRSQDYGYLMSEILQIIKDLYNVKIAIIDKTLVIYDYKGKDQPHPLVKEDKKSFFADIKNTRPRLQPSGFVIPEVYDQPFRYNTDEIAGNRLISFEVDPFDDYTIDNYEGVSVEIRTSPKNTNFSDKTDLIKGNKELRFPICHGHRLQNLNDLKKIFSNFLEALTFFKSFFGIKTSITNEDYAIGGLVLSSEYFSKPKLLIGNPMTGSLAAFGDFSRSVKTMELSDEIKNDIHAQNIYVNHYKDDITFANPYTGQKIIFEGIKIPFGIEDFVKTSQSNICVTSSGQPARIRSIEWDWQADFALISYEIRQPYSYNIKEEIYAPR